MKCVILTAIYLIGYSANGARIFEYFPTASISHQVVFRPLTLELVKRGHHVVVVTADPVKYADPEFANLTEIDVHDISYDHMNLHFNYVQERMESTSVLRVIQNMFKVIEEVIELQFAHPDVHNLLHGPEQKFDLCIFEALTVHVYPFKEKFNCSMILFSSMPGMPQIHEDVGNPTHPILYPDVVQPYAEPLSLMQKFSAVQMHVALNRLLPVLHSTWDVFRIKHFPKSNNTLEELRKSADLVFFNYHPILLGIRPIVPVYVTLGSMHILPPKPLPSNFQTILDKAQHGVIYFSLGSNVKSIHLPEETRKIFLDAFRQMPYTVLWKWENETLPDQPPNVYISKWLPQQDILNHPNVKLFMTQCGQQSLEEAVHYNVPVIAIPFLIDQIRNAEIVSSRKIGKSLHVVSITKEEIKQTVTEVIVNKIYRETISKLRDQIYDEPQTSLEKAVWWTEYLLRHGGTQHLRSPSADVSFYQYFLLDLLAIAVTCAALILGIVFIILRKLYRYLVPPKLSSINKTKTN